MQKVRKRNVVKALVISFVITIAIFFSVDMPFMNKALYLPFVAAVSFASLLYISTITSRAYERFTKQM